MMLGRTGENETLNRMMSSALPLQKDDRVPQWSHQETRDFISIRAELERDFKVAKRNKTLWEIVSAKMKERGHRRSPDQCKCKWKNLVNRYKGKETSDPENGRQCPFFDELHAVFTERGKNMHRLLVESESGGGGVHVQMKKKKNTKKAKRLTENRSSDESSDEDDDVEDKSEEERVTIRNKKRKSIKDNTGGIQEMLQGLFQQQQRMEMQWREMMERRAMERRMFEQEWRQSMEKLERERLMIDQAWREREEQRRMREESRAEKRDALLTTLLNKLIREDHL